MRLKNKIGFVSLFVTCLFFLPGCSKDPLRDLYGTWKGQTKIDQTMTITLRPDSTIEIEIQGEDVRTVRKGTYELVDRRLRTTLTTLETFTGKAVKREEKVDQDEAVLTMTSKNELVLRKGTQAVVLERVLTPN